MADLHAARTGCGMLERVIGEITDIDSHLRELAAAWAREPDVAAVWLFGSRASGQARRWSDVDLAVAFRTGIERPRRAELRDGLAADARRRLRTDAVDLVVVEDAPSLLGQRVVSRGRLLAVADARRTVEVVEDVMRRYLDESALRQILDAGLATRLREGRYGS